MSDVLSQEELDALLGGLTGPETPTPGARQHLGAVGRVRLPICVEVGRARISLGDLLALRPGAVLRLDRPTASRTTLTVQGQPFAHGEVVVVGEHFGLRITRPHRR